MRRIFAYFLIILSLFVLGCTPESNSPLNPPDEITAEQSPAMSAEQPIPSQSPEVVAGAAIKTNPFNLFGLVIKDDSSDMSNMTMLGFLRSTENLAVAAKIYRIAENETALDATKRAIADGVNALMVFEPSNQVYSNAAIAEASKAGIFVACPYYLSESPGLDCNVVTDTTEYLDELSRGIANRMHERNLKSGRLLVYGDNIQTEYTAFYSSVKSAYPQFWVDAFCRTQVDADAAIDELANYLLHNRDIKGMYVADANAAVIAVEARGKAQARLKKEGAPKDSLQSNAPFFVEPPTTPPAESILNKITITVYCSGLSDANFDLFNENDIYALCIEPYYEAAAEATMYLDRLVNGETVQRTIKINRPIVYGETAEKYKAIFEQMKKEFR